MTLPMSPSAHDSDRFRRFVGLRRKWFRSAFAVAFFICAAVANRKFDSLVEVAGFALVGALIAATVLSLAGMPLVWRISGRFRKSER